MIVTFVGHGELYDTDQLQTLLRDAIEEIIHHNETTFYCGGYGRFDLICAHIVKELKSSYPQTRSVFVTPYRTEKSLRAAKESNLYDEILFAGLENIPPRLAIIKRNEYMVDQADLILAFVDHTWGGAYRTLSYAKKRKKNILNLSGVQI